MKTRKGLALGVVLGGCTTLVVIMQTPGQAFNQVSIPPHATRDYCIAASPPGVSTSRAAVLLDDSIQNYNLAGWADGGSALNLSRVACSDPSMDVKITTGTFSDPSTLALTSNAGDKITFSTDRTWWDGTGTRPSAQYYYEGVLAHEMGHTLGMGHEGGDKWSYDGNLPTMADCISASQSTVMADESQEDWGDEDWVRGASDFNFWSANAGYEDGFAYWAHSANTEAGSSYAKTGDLGVRMHAVGEYVYITHTYDPYNGRGLGVAYGMTTSPSLHTHTAYKNPSGTSGGVKAQYQYRYLRWDPTSALCKTDQNATATFTSWSSVITLATCANSTVWNGCGGAVDIGNSNTNASTAYRARIESNSSEVNIDRTGAWGGTTP